MVDSSLNFLIVGSLSTMHVLLDVHVASNDQRRALACSVASSHDDLHEVTSTSSYVKISTKSFNSLLLRSPASSPRCHSTLSDVTSLSSLHLVEWIQRENLHVVIHMTSRLHKYGPADFVSHGSQGIPEQQLDLKTLLHWNSKLLAQIVQYSSTYQVFLHLLPLVFFCQRGRLPFCPLRAGFPDVTARCVRMSNHHLLVVSVPAFHRHIPCTSLNSSSFPLFDSLCLSDYVFVHILSLLFPSRFSQ